MEPEGALKELQALQNFHVVYEGDRVKAFIQWAREHAERLYPDVGQRGYLVPPIFVHKHSTRFDPSVGAEILQEYQKSSPKGEKAHSHVARSFCLLSPLLEAPLFIISGLEYDNLLKWVRHHPHLAPPLPHAVENRGDIDIMLIHPRHGVTFIQVKAVGDNAESRTPTEIQKKIALGGRQLRKDDNVLRWVLQDWPEASSCHVTHVVALPNLTRQEVADIWPPRDLDPGWEEANYTDGVVFLCKDDLPSAEEPTTPEADVDVTSLMTWWKSHVAGVDCTLTLPFMKDTVSRYVGLLSAVEVYAGNNLRREVRLTSDAIDVCGMMFRRILLNEHQLRILTTPCQRRYLSGPPGSGKTVLLVLRARQFLRHGGHVIVVNMYRGAPGRAIGHFIRDSVARFRLPQGHEGRKGKGKNKAKKKKAEERTPTEDTLLNNASKNPRTPPTPRKPTTDNTLPPPKTGKQESLLPHPQIRMPIPVKKVQEGQQSKLLSTSPSSRRTPGISSSSGRKKDSSPAPGTPPSARKAGGGGSSSGCREAQSTPPLTRKRQDSEVDMSDRVHCVDIDIDKASFHRQEFERQIRHCLPADIKADDVMFVVDEIYVKEYWSEVLEVLSSGFQGCTVWCAGLYSRNPPTFQQEDLMQVLRCPPLVQKVLHAVDWDPERRSRYRLETDSSSGIYTQGLVPLSVRHQDHPQVSITECPQCASHLASLLLHGLGLTLPPPTNTISSSTSTLTPPGGRPAAQGDPGVSTILAAGGDRCPQQPSSAPGGLFRSGQNGQGTMSGQILPGANCGEESHRVSGSGQSGQTACCGRPGEILTSGEGCGRAYRGECGQVSGCGDPDQASGSGDSGRPGSGGCEAKGGPGGSVPLSCCDVVMLVNIPRALYEPDARGFLDTTKQDFSNYMAYLAACPLVTTLRSLGVPIQVVNSLPCWDLHHLQDGQVSVAWAYTYQGLENKVVIYLPGDTPWIPDPHQREIPAPGLCPCPREDPKVWRPTTAQHLTSGGGCRCDKDGMDLTALREQLSGDVEGLSCQCQRDRAGDDENVAPSSFRAEHCDHDDTKPSATNTHSNKNLRGSSQSHEPAEATSEQNQDTSALAQNPRAASQHLSHPEVTTSGQSGMTGHKAGRLTLETGGLNMAEYWWREEDIKRYSNWDKSNLFVAGSRCLSQLIMFIP